MTKRILSVLLVFVLLLPTVAFAVTSDTISVREPMDAQGTVKKVSSRRFSFRCQYKNYNTSKTVKSFDVVYYTADEYDDQNSALTYENVPVRIKPYSTEWTTEIFAENVEHGYYLYIAVWRVTFTDGTREELDIDDVSYTRWDNSGAWWLE